MKLHRLQFAQYEVLKVPEGVRVCRVPSPLHHTMACIAFTAGQRAGLAAVSGL